MGHSALYLEPAAKLTTILERWEPVPPAFRYIVTLR